MKRLSSFFVTTTLLLASCHDNTIPTDKGITVILNKNNSYSWKHPDLLALEKKNRPIDRSDPAGELTLGNSP